MPWDHKEHGRQNPDGDPVSNVRDKDFDFYFGKTIPYVKYEPDANGNIIYVGYYPPTSSVNDNTWLITRHIYDVNGNPTDSRTRVNISWANRATI